MYADDEEYIIKKTKGQQKREAEAAQMLGAELVKLSSAQLKDLCVKLDLSDKLFDAIDSCRSIRAREAHRRQLQYIGKLMRGLELEPIQNQLAQIQRSGQIATAQLHQLEHWRERLLTEGQSALDELVLAYPAIDTAQLQQLIAAAQKEALHNQPPRAARQLFRYLREIIGE